MSTTPNILASQFNAKSLLRYALPTICMMVFSSIYVIVDGLFVANLVGEDALSAINIIMPVINILLAIGLMFATGGTAVMGRLMGEGRSQEARSFLSLIYLVSIALGTLLTALFLLFPTQIVTALGGTGDLFSYSMDYLMALAFFSTTFFLQVFAQSFFVLAGKPMVGFAACAAGGCTNMLLDYLFISPDFLNLGIAGAGLATGIGNAIPGLYALLYFLVNRKGTLYFAPPVFHGKALLQSICNGSSELVSQLSIAITTLLFNVILLQLVGTAGVASISVILYIQLIQAAIYFGYAIGIVPIISYKYGAQDTAQLRIILTISFRFIMAASVLVIAATLLFGDVAVAIFISPESSTFAMAKHGLRLFSLTYLFMGVNMLMSSVFTALSNGLVSAILSFSRTLLFLVLALTLLPKYFHLNGVWLAVPLAELLGFLVALYFYKKYKSHYHY